MSAPICFVYNNTFLRSLSAFSFAFLSLFSCFVSSLLSFLKLEF